MRLAPAIFLRPPRRGTGSIAICERIDKFLAGDYEALVAAYLRDLLQNHRRQVHFVEVQDSANALRERTLRKILDDRDWSRAVRALYVGPTNARDERAATSWFFTCVPAAQLEEYRQL